MKPSRAPTSAAWRRRPSREEAAVITDRAWRDFPCPACGALPGEPCADPGPGRPVHGPRFRQARKVTHSEAVHGPAALASLPRVPASEIEAARLPNGGHRFTREWFESHGLPFPPPAGWLAAVTRAGD